MHLQEAVAHALVDAVSGDVFNVHAFPRHRVLIAIGVIWLDAPVMSEWWRRKTLRRVYCVFEHTLPQDLCAKNSSASPRERVTRGARASSVRVSYAVIVVCSEPPGGHAEG